MQWKSVSTQYLCLVFSRTYVVRIIIIHCLIDIAVTFQFIGDKPLNLKYIVSSFHGTLENSEFTTILLENSQFTDLMSIPLLYQNVIEGLFIHYFPDTNDSKAVYNKKDIEFFLLFANEQNKWKVHVQTGHQNDLSDNFIGLSKFKFFLDRILCKGWCNNGEVAKPMTFYKLEVSNNSL